MTCARMRRQQAARSVLSTLLLTCMLASCNRQTKKVKVQTIPPYRSLGQRDDIDAQDFFGRLMDVRMDSSGNIYVLDSTVGEVKTFSWSGAFIRSYGNGIGDGPGEIRRCYNFCLDDSGKVYMSEHLSNKVSVFRPDGAFLEEIRLPFEAGSVAASSTDRVYATRFAPTREPVLIRFSPIDRSTTEGIQPDQFTELVASAGFSSQIDRLGGLLALVTPFPYSVHLLDEDLAVIHSWRGPPGVVDDPPERQPDRRVHWNAMVYNVVVGRDSLLYVVSAKPLRDTGKLDGTLDVFTLNGTHMARIPQEILGYGFIMRFVVSEEHRMAAAVDMPFPSVVWFDLSPLLGM